ncbi:uncharacterized protein [Nicotiana tomentosiformis]|uniref:uncharacterized protein n=1 Tax=Nicotiana tomentosiformis TaxID=4098 RepID=UPI00388CE496
MAFSLHMDDGTLRYQGRLCIPNVDGLRERIMTEAHTSRYYVHCGSTRMYNDLKEVYWWNNMKRNVPDFVARCPDCQQVKAEHQRPGGLAQNIEIPIRDDHLPLIEFAYNNSYHASIQMAPFEAQYGRRCRFPIRWFEIGEAQSIGPDLVHQDMEKVKISKEQLKTTQNCQKSYLDIRRRDLEFQDIYWVFLNVSPMKGVMRFGKKDKLSPRYVRPYKIIQRISPVAYRLELPPEMYLVHLVFHVSMLRKVVGDPSLIVPVETIERDEQKKKGEKDADLLKGSRPNELCLLLKIPEPSSLNQQKNSAKERGNSKKAKTRNPNVLSVFVVVDENIKGPIYSVI